MATVRPALVLKNRSTGREVGVNERMYARLIGRTEWEDAGSTALFAKMPLPGEFPKREELTDAGHLTVGEVAMLDLDGLASIEGVGKTTAKKIRKVIERGHLELDEPEEGEDEKGEGEKEDA